MGQSRQNEEDVSGACGPGGDGMEVGKGQQAQAHREAVAVYQYHCGQTGGQVEKPNGYLSGPPRTQKKAIVLDKRARIA